MSRGWLSNGAGPAGLALAGLLTGLVLAEGVLRVSGVSFPVFDTYDDLRGVALRPGKEGWYRTEGKAFVRINSYGYRDDERSVPKPTGRYRIAVLGDSFTEARQVATHHTFTALLGPSLSSCWRGGGVEVLNFGVGGYGTTEELLTLQEDVLRFAPDLVLLAFFPGNDVQDNSRQLRRADGWRMPRPAFVLSEGRLVLDDSFRSSLPRRLLYEAVHHSRLLEVLNEARRSWAARRGATSPPSNDPQFRIAPGVFAPPADAAWREGWEITEELLRTMSREVASAGARFAVAIVTIPEQVHPDETVRLSYARKLGVEDLLYPSRRLQRLGEASGFQVISLVERMQRTATHDREYFHGFPNSKMGDGHWNEAGHREAARILVEELCATLSASRDRSAPGEGARPPC